MDFWRTLQFSPQLTNGQLRQYGSKNGNYRNSKNHHHHLIINLLFHSKTQNFLADYASLISATLQLDPIPRKCLLITAGYMSNASFMNYHHYAHCVAWGGLDPWWPWHHKQGRSLGNGGFSASNITIKSCNNNPQEYVISSPPVTGVIILIWLKTAQYQIYGFLRMKYSEQISSLSLSWVMTYWCMLQSTHSASEEARRQRDQEQYNISYSFSTL